ncbi:SUKH-3 domain-containing protein [Streptomyces sp. R-07]|uniref:SUKH-3 domain-containing protein n=1 Tax=Streptomyces sp. R-07 TaxID=3404052 RepID=UPI003CE87D85
MHRLADRLGTRLFPLGRTGAEAPMAVDEEGRLLSLGAGGAWFHGETVRDGLLAMTEGLRPVRLRLRPDPVGGAREPRSAVRRPPWRRASPRSTPGPPPSEAAGLRSGPRPGPAHPRRARAPRARRRLRASIRRPPVRRCLRARPVPRPGGPRPLLRPRVRHGSAPALRAATTASRRVWAPSLRMAERR